jgi:hypothetical protein
MIPPNWLLDHETLLRLGFFVGTFAIVAAWELWSPQRALTLSRATRWRANLGLVVLNTALLRLALPAAAVGMAATSARAQGWGLLNHLAVPLLAGGAHWPWWRWTLWCGCSTSWCTPCRHSGGCTGCTMPTWTTT